MAKYDDVEELRFQKTKSGLQTGSVHLCPGLLEYKAAGVQQMDVMADREYFSHLVAPDRAGKLESTQAPVKVFVRSR